MSLAFILKISSSEEVAASMPKSSSRLKTTSRRFEPLPSATERRFRYHRAYRCAGVARFEEVGRCAALEAGADVCFEAMQTVDELKSAPKEIHGHVFGMSYAVERRRISFAEAEEMGYKIGRASLLLIQAIGACDQALADMKVEGRHPKPSPTQFADAFARVGAAEWDPRREQYREPAVKDAAE